MAERTLQISDNGYQRLREQADQLHTTPDQLLERLLASDALLLLDERTVQVAEAESEDVPACAAVKRLTTLFADVQIPYLEETLRDPLLTLAQADLLP